MTPKRIVHTWGGKTWEIAWAELLEPRFDSESGDVELVVRGHGAHTVSTHLLVISGPALVLFLEAFQNDPAKRAALGTEQGRRQAEEIRDLVELHDFRPVVHSVPRLFSPGVWSLLSVVGAVVFLGLVMLGRSSSIDDDELAEDLERQLSEQGREIRGVTCEDNLRKEVGESVKCHGTEAGQERLITVRVTAVQDDAFQYDLRVE
jgi:hypothetical protein